MRAGEELLSTANDANIPVYILRNDANLRPLAAAYALFNEMKKRKPVLMHLGTVFPNVWGRLLGKLLKTPIIIGGCKGQGNIKLQHEKFLHGLAHAHICDAMSIKLALEDLGIAKNKVHCITNGVNTEFFTPGIKDNTKQDVLCVGRMVLEKDHATLLRAFALVIKKLPKAHLHLVGDGPLRTNLEKLSTNLELNSSITFHGSSSDVRSHMQAANVLVLSSISEGTPNVLLEGMACELPIVATAVAGIPDMVGHEKQGLLVKPSNEHELAKAIINILENSDLANNMGKSGRIHVQENYSLENVARAHEAIYLELCANKELI